LTDVHAYYLVECSKVRFKFSRLHYNSKGTRVEEEKEEKVEEKEIWHAKRENVSNAYECTPIPRCFAPWLPYILMLSRFVDIRTILADFPNLLWNYERS
jgi:hypothetical protein